jgi:hypothetical protein
MPIQPIECRCQSSADGHLIHQRADSLTRLSADRPQRPSAEEKPSHCPIKCFRIVPTRSSLRVDIALHHQARSKCIQECSNAFIASRRITLHQGPCLKFDVAICTRTSENQDLSQSNSWAVRQRVGVRLRWCHWQMAKKRPKEIECLVRHSAVQLQCSVIHYKPDLHETWELGPFLCPGDFSFSRRIFPAYTNHHAKYVQFNGSCRWTMADFGQHPSRTIALKD